MKVKVWAEQIVIPTYEVGEPDKNPMFLEKRVYQGSSGSFYPYPAIEKIYDNPVDKTYNALWLENEYIKVMILPEIGGRVQMAWDKIAGRHFVYYNHVIKPALVGLTGPWISGGIEFNWPQHHRPSTFMPLDYTIEELPDGGATVWVNEQERMTHQKATAGFTLRPGYARLEITGKVSNPTPFPQTFLWWANPAVAVNDHYQSVFPPDVNAVFDHGKRDVATFPIATGTYYKMDYSAGVDISKYKNIPVPTSYMAVNSEYDFVGGYENDTRAGLLHVANHHVSPGKKQWTWGNGDFGQAWDRNLTDEDGPYIELMTGMYCDNQPDFAWLQPYEEKSFVQYFMPYRELGLVKRASEDLLLNIEPTAEGVVLRLFATRDMDGVGIAVSHGEEVIFEETSCIGPEQVFGKVIYGEFDFSRLTVSIYGPDGDEILFWKPEKEETRPVPEPAKSALPAAEIATTEELFLTGQHLEQYRHATYDPTEYYREALSRDPDDIRNNNAYGLWLLRRGRFEESEKYLRRAVSVQLEKNPNPYDGEPLYNLAVTLKLQGKTDEAYDRFYKACWNAAWQDAGYFSLAQISTGRGKYAQALGEVDRSLLRNWHSHPARHLKTIILRKLSRQDEALDFIRDSLGINKFNFGCLFEKFLITGNEEDRETMLRLMRGECHNYREIAWDYINAGCFSEALALLSIAGAHCGQVSPMAAYLEGYCHACAGRTEEAVAAFERAGSMKPDYCFPNRVEEVLALRCAQEFNPAGARAYYYLGNLYYDKRQHHLAIGLWEKSVALDGHYPTALRNLALGYFNKLGKKDEAVVLLERAYNLDTTDARVLMELDQLYKRLNRPHEERLRFLGENYSVVLQRDDLYLEYVTLLNQTGDYREAMRMIDQRNFHPWEGGEGKVPAQYQYCRIMLAREYMEAGDWQEAEKLIGECYDYPHNLGEGKLHGAQDNDLDYYMGVICENTGRGEEAETHFRKASCGPVEPTAAIYYNDQKPDKIFYQGLALLKLGNGELAASRFNKLVDYGEKHISDKIRIDYFAVSLPDLLIWEDDLDMRNRVHCNYLIGLGCLGLGRNEQSQEYLRLALDEDNNHMGVSAHLDFPGLLFGLADRIKASKP